MRLDGQMSLADESPEYAAFVEKFKPKKTTDDCYTPENIYDVVADWVAEEYGADRGAFVRPFWPGADYRTYEYPTGCVVVDNPPFSLLSAIVDDYLAAGVRFFLFAPALTSLLGGRCCTVAVNAAITYANGADVPTAFVTNLDQEHALVTAPELLRRLNAANDVNLKAGKVQLPSYVYPYDVITASRAGWLSKYGADFRLRRSEATFIRAMDAQRPYGKAVFGGGYLMSERAAAERAAAERAAAERAAAKVWQLSDREKALQKMLGEGRES